MSVKDRVVEDRSLPWKKDKRGPIFIHKKEAFAAYDEGLQEIFSESKKGDGLVSP
ncbi:MAG: hypothetical protein FWH47_00275 [Methanomassiliicoccaceae archaeon]|nr:hypothetical protein [Methanomassiliicoccaceae archaeon]